MEFKIIAKTFQGLEEVLAKEVTALGANNISIGNRMVTFTGNQEMLYRANFCLRTAVRILKPIHEFEADNADTVYEIVKKIDWQNYMDEKQTFLVDSVVFSNTLRHSKFVAYRVKDAIADYFREQTGERPNVSISNPDIRINVHIAETHVTISLDSSGESLHKRGYRTGTVAAPINEVLAAGIIMLTGWDGDTDFIDPFCGSGTILVEAALIAKNIYPGVFREEFGFERWHDFDPDLLERIYNDDSQERDFLHHIYGFDINRQCVSIATDNVRSAGVSKIVSVEQKDFYNFQWDENAEPAIMITNPPYGERITTNDILDLYSTIGERLKHAFVGNDAWILSSHEECFNKIGMRPSTKFALLNGNLPCELRKYQIFSGKLEERRSEGLEIKTKEELRRNKHFKPLHKREDSEFDGHKWNRTNHDNHGSRDDEHYFRSRPDRRNHFSKHENKDGDRKHDKKPFDKKPFDKKRDFKNSESKKYGDKKRDFKRNDKHRNSEWGFDSEGRPFRK